MIFDNLNSCDIIFYMGKIYRQNVEQGFSGNLITEPEHPTHEGLPATGQEFMVDYIDVLAKRNVKGLKVKRVTHSFVTKIHKKETSGSNQEIRNDQATEAYGKFMALKAINKKLPKGDDGFNLPNTVRMVADKCEKSLLVSDLTSGGKFKLYDLKYYFEFKDQLPFELKNVVEKQIKKDLALAEKNKITLTQSANINFPLDTWCLVVNPETGDGKVFIMDVGRNVHLDVTDEQLDASRCLVEKHLALFKEPRKKF